MCDINIQRKKTTNLAKNLMMKTAQMDQSKAMQFRISSLTLKPHNTHNWILHSLFATRNCEQTRSSQTLSFPFFNWWETESNNLKNQPLIFKFLALHALSNHPLDLLGEEQSRKKWFWVAWAKETGGWGANIRRVHLDQKQPNRFEVWTLGAQSVS